MVSLPGQRELLANLDEEKEEALAGGNLAEARGAAWEVAGVVQDVNKLNTRNSGLYTSLYCRKLKGQKILSLPCLMINLHKYYFGLEKCQFER